MLTFDDVFKTIPVTGAIVTVQGLTLSADHNTVTFTVSYRASSADEGNNYSDGYFSFPYDKAGGDIVSQAYTYLKSLDKFASATEL